MKHHFLLLLAFLLMLYPSAVSSQVTTEEGWYATNEIQDIALIYYGATWRNKGTLEDFKPLVAHTFADGHIDWFFPGFLFLEIDFNQVTFCRGFGKRNATREDWQKYIDLTFRQDRGLKALDACIEYYKRQIGDPPFKHKIVVGIPSPIKDNMDWGRLNNRNLYFSRSNDRVTAVKWYIDNYEQRFKSAGYKNIEIEGYYWIDEDTKNAGDVIKAVGDYVHSLGRRYYWIPYFTAPGRFSWRELGFDIAYLQPNYFFHPGKVEKNRIEEACQLARRYGMGLEFEMDHRHLEQRHTFSHRAVDYLDAFERNGVFESSAIAYYFQGKTVNLLAASDVKEDKELLDRWATYVVERNNRKKANQTIKRSSNQEDNTSDQQLGRTPPNLKKGTRKLNPEDWRF